MIRVQNPIEELYNGATPIVVEPKVKQELNLVWVVWVEWVLFEVSAVGVVGLRVFFAFFLGQDFVDQPVLPGLFGTHVKV